MLPEVARAGLRLGVLILLLSVGTLALQRPASAEFWATVAAAVVALVFIGGLVFILSITHQSPPGKE